MGRPLSQAPGEVAGFEERARHMIAIAPETLADVAVEPKARLHPLHPARSLGLRLRHRALELPIPHRRQRRRAGPDGGQRRALEALRPDPALRRALRRGLRRGRPARGAVPAPASQSRRGLAADRAPGRRLRLLHRLGARGCCGAEGGRRPLHRHRPRARRQGPGLCARRCQPRARRCHPGGRRLLQLRPILLRHRAHLCPRGPLRRLRRRGRRPDPRLQARQSAGGRREPGAPGARLFPRLRARPDRRGHRRRGPSAHRSGRLSRRRGRHALHGPADPDRGRPLPCGS